MQDSKPQTTNIDLSHLVTELLEVIQVEKIEDNLYRGISKDFVGKRVFGGQVLAQALMSASHTADRPAHSLHAYFMRAGDIAAPIVYQVENLRDGNTILTRQVKAIQYGKVIFTAIISFAKIEEGLNFQIEEPKYKQPDELLNEQQIKENIKQFIPKNIRERIMRQRHIEIKPVEVRNEFAPEPSEPKQAAWFRVLDEKNVLPSVDDYKTHQAMFAFMSDYYLLGTSLYPHGLSFLSTPNLQAATIDHSIHFHRQLDVSQWLLNDMHCHVTNNARGLNQGTIWQNGTLVASTQQEGLIRLREPDEALQ